MRLIDADALVSALNNGRLKEQTGRAVPFNAGVAFALTMVEYAPTIDAVPVVRCKGCKWFGKTGCAIEIVDETDMPKENDFCSFGERKDHE